MNIILVRNDNIGDLILSFPLFSLLKERFPQGKLSLIGPDYLEPIAQCCQQIDHFISLTTLYQQPEIATLQQLKALQAEAILFLSPNKKLWLQEKWRRPIGQLARWAKKAGIRYRIGSTHRFFSWLYCNQRITISKKPISHEAHLNLQLARFFGISAEKSVTELTSLIKLVVNPAWKIKAQTWLAPDRFNLIIHPGSHGNGREWTEKHYITLIHSLPAEKFHILITGSAAEKERFQSLIQSCPTAVDLFGQTTTSEFIGLLSCANGFVSSGTGPLHLAAGLGIHALGLYPKNTLIGARRWGPLGEKAEYLNAENAICPKDCKAQTCSCMQTLLPTEVKKRVTSWLV